MINYVPGNPSEEESKRDTMAGLGLKVGDDLRDFRDSPTDQADKPKTEREVISEIAEAILEVLVNPTHAGLSLSYTIRQCHSSRSLSLFAVSKRLRLSFIYTTLKVVTGW